MDQSWVQITFTGLCVLVIEDHEQWPGNPDSVEAWLVDTRDENHWSDHHPPHRPLLCFRARDYLIGPHGDDKVGIAVGPDGEEIVGISLHDHHIQIVVEESSNQAFEMEWHDPWKDNHHRMNLVPDLRHFGIDSIHVDNGLPQGVTSRVKLPYGKFEPRRVVKDGLHPSGYMQFQFPDQSPHPIADHVALTCDRPLNKVVKIILDHDEDKAYELIQPPGDEGLSLSITNLPAKVHLGSTDLAMELGIHHLKWYGMVSATPNINFGTVKLPKPPGGGLQTYGSGICPTTRIKI